MDGPLALRSEIIHDSRNAIAKELFPEPVHDRACSEWIFGRDNPSREVQPGQRSSIGIRRLGQKMRKFRLNNFTTYDHPITARKHARQHLVPSITYHAERPAVAAYPH